MSDNIGGIGSAEYCFATDARVCCVMSTGIIVNLISSKDWNDFQATPGKIEITVTPETSNGVTTFTVSGTILIPKQRELSLTDQIQIRKRGLLIRYMPFNGHFLVVGDKANPITATIENLNPPTASGYRGQKITISGVMTHSELPLL